MSKLENNYKETNPRPLTDNEKSEIIKALKLAIMFMDKQRPISVIEYCNGYFVCPNCKSAIRYPLVERINYCPYCGQAIKWEVDME